MVLKSVLTTVDLVSSVQKMFDVVHDYSPHQLGMSRYQSCSHRLDSDVWLSVSSETVRQLVCVTAANQ